MLDHQLGKAINVCFVSLLPKRISVTWNQGSWLKITHAQTSSYNFWYSYISSLLTKFLGSKNLRLIDCLTGLQDLSSHILNNEGRVITTRPPGNSPRPSALEWGLSHSKSEYPLPILLLNNFCVLLSKMWVGSSTNLGGSISLQGSKCLCADHTTWYLSVVHQVPILSPWKAPPSLSGGQLCWAEPLLWTIFTCLKIHHDFMRKTHDIDQGHHFLI